MSNLGHIVYTRGRFPRTLDGDVRNTEGYGIISMSKDIADQNKMKDPLFITKILQITNSSKEAFSGEPGRDIHSSVYAVPAVGDPVLAFIHYRNGEEVSSYRIHQRPVFLTDAVMGKFDRYPCSFFGADCFSAEKQTADYYYPDEAFPMGAPIDSDGVQYDESLRSRAMEFAKSHRDLVRDAVWFVLQQLTLPAPEQKTLIIRDTEENLRLWVAAITFSLPLSLALKVSFNTNGVKFSDLTDFQYCVQKSTQMCDRMFNIQSPDLERHNLALIVGADPAWKASYSTAALKPSLPYVVIDAKTNQAQGIEPGDAVNNNYFQSIVSNDEDIKNFCSFINEMKNIEPGINLGNLFDACRALSSDKPYQYAVLIRYLKILAPHLTGKSCLLVHVINRLFGPERLYVNLADEDEKNGLALMKMCLAIFKAFSFPRFKPEMISCISQKMRVNLAQMRSAAPYLDILVSSNPAALESVLSQLVDEDHLKFIPAEKINTSSDEFIRSLFSLINNYCSQSGRTLQQLMKDPELGSVVSETVKRSITNPQIAQSVLMELKNDQNSLTEMIKTGFDMAGDENKKHFSWCQCLVRSGIDGGELCRIIKSFNGKSLDIELVLVAMIKEQGCTPEIRRLFDQYLSKVPERGFYYYIAWFDSIKDKPDRVLMIRAMLDELKREPERAVILQKLLPDIDKTITYENSRTDAELVKMISPIAEENNINCPHTAVYRFVENLSAQPGGGLLSRKDQNSLNTQYLKINPKCVSYPVELSFANSQVAAKFVRIISGHADEFSAIVIAVKAFLFGNDMAKKSFMKMIAYELCPLYVKRKNDFVTLLVHVRESVDQIPVFAGDPVTKIIKAFPADGLKQDLDELIKACILPLSEYKLDGISEKILANCTKTYGAKTAARLGKLLKEAKAIYDENHSGGFFSKLFGKK